MRGEGLEECLSRPPPWNLLAMSRLAGSQSQGRSLGSFELHHVDHHQLCSYCWYWLHRRLRTPNELESEESQDHGYGIPCPVDQCGCHYDVRAFRSQGKFPRRWHHGLDRKWTLLGPCLRVVQRGGSVHDFDGPLAGLLSAHQLALDLGDEAPPHLRSQEAEVFAPFVHSLHLPPFRIGGGARAATLYHLCHIRLLAWNAHSVDVPAGLSGTLLLGRPLHPPTRVPCTAAIRLRALPMDHSLHSRGLVAALSHGCLGLRATQGHSKLLDDSILL
mmetsp:Transcript_8889/g.19759  ORF Transcript_8889/g.19759 Transcript_8889/m.19759 type:complete len:274 (+) Transcript_8889:15-836(+)